MKARSRCWDYVLPAILLLLGLAGFLVSIGCGGRLRPAPPVATPTATSAPTPTPTAAPTVEPTPKPKPTPDSCPVLIKIGIGPLGNPFRDGAGRPCQWLDSTPRFAGKFCPRADGCPCNAEHNEVCSNDGKSGTEYRHCEPKTEDELVITAVSGVRSIFAPGRNPADPANVRRGYQIAVCGPPGSQYVVKIDLADGAMGGDGKPIYKIFGFEPAVLKGTFR